MTQDNFGSITVHESRYNFYKVHSDEVDYYDRVVATSKGISRLLAKFDRYIAKDDLESHMRMVRLDYSGDTYENTSAFEEAILEDKNRELVSE